MTTFFCHIFVTTVTTITTVTTVTTSTIGTLVLLNFCKVTFSTTNKPRTNGPTDKQLKTIV